MTREDFERELFSIQRESNDAMEIYRAFGSQYAVTFSAKCVLMEKAEQVLHRVKMLMLMSERTVAISCSNRINAPFLPPSIDIKNSLLNWDNER